MDICAGKAAYDSMNAATKIAKEINKRKYLRGRNHNHAPARAYKCDFCGKWHLTGQKRKRIQA